jgi:hypothetical protein
MEGPSPGLRGGFVLAVPEAPIALVPFVGLAEQAASRLKTPAIITSLNMMELL